MPDFWQWLPVNVGRIMTDGPYAPPGRYADPTNPGQPRYWTGAEWAPPSPPLPYAAGMPAYFVQKPSTHGFAIASVAATGHSSCEPSPYHPC